VVASARAQVFDGHICGHIHYGRIANHAGVLYINDGDWVEHCTALVEHADGALELLHWTGQSQTLTTSAAIATLPEGVPVAA
jgi:UDP-2,3-diacylglucosamine pyrophosphatase LpxH